MMKAIPSLIIRLRRNENGSAPVEFAFIGSLLIMLTLGAFELGRLAYTYQKLASATGVASRLAGMGAFDETIADIIRARFSPGERSALTIDITPQEIDGLPYKRVDAQFVLPLIIPGFNLLPGAAGNSITVHAVQLIPVS